MAIAAQDQNASPRSIRSYSTQDFARELADTSGELVDSSEHRVAFDDEVDDVFEGLENVRVCCGEHDVAQLSAHRHGAGSHGHNSHRHRHQSQPALPQPNQTGARDSMRRGKKSLGSLFGTQ